MIFPNQKSTDQTEALVSSRFAETRFAEIRVGLGLAFRRIETEPNR